MLSSILVHTVLVSVSLYRSETIAMTNFNMMNTVIKLFINFLSIVYSNNKILLSLKMIDVWAL